MEPLYKGHIGTLETVLYREVVLHSDEDIHEKDTCPVNGTSYIGHSELRTSI